MTTPKKAPLKKVAKVVEEPVTPPTPEPLMLKGATYDWFKRSAQLILPALGALYFSLAQIWGLPKADEVVGTIAALNLFFGVVTTISAKRYYNSDARFAGSIDITDGDTRTLFSLNLDGDPEDLAKKDEVTFKIKS